MARVSLTEQYDDKDVIKQIYKLWDAVDKGTVKDLNVVRDNGNIKITVKFHDDEVKEFTLEDDEIQNVTQSQSGSQVTITIVMKSGTTYPFTFTAATGVTVDTDQTVTGMKVFSAASTNFSHDVDVGADLNVGGAVEANELTVDTDAVVDGNLNVGGNLGVTGHVTGNVTMDGDLEVGNLAIEANGSTSMVSNASGIEVSADTPVTFRQTPKLGTGTLGSASKPIYLDGGVPTVATQVVDTTSAQTIGWNAAKTFESGGGATGHLFFRQGEGRNNNIGMIDAKNTAGEVRARIYAQTYGSSGRLHLHSFTGEHLGGISVGYKGDNTVATLTDAIPSNADSNTIVTKGFVADTTGGNNLMHRDGDESAAGTKANTGRWDRNTNLHNITQTPSAYWEGLMNDLVGSDGQYIARTNMVSQDANGTFTLMFGRVRNTDANGNIISAQLQLSITKTGVVTLSILDAQGKYHSVFKYGDS